MAAKRQRVEIYADARKKWRWRYRARNGEIIAESGQGYYRKDRAINAFGRFAEMMEMADYDIVDKATGQIISSREDNETRAEGDPFEYADPQT